VLIRITTLFNVLAVPPVAVVVIMIVYVPILWCVEFVLFCFSSSCVSYVASFSRLSIFGCLFGILCINILSVYDNTLGLVCFMVFNAPFNNILVSYILGFSCIQIHICVLSWLGKYTAIGSDVLKLALWVQTIPLNPCNMLLIMKVNNVVVHVTFT
jgi:hypothetical protein